MPTAGLHYEHMTNDDTYNPWDEITPLAGITPRIELTVHIRVLEHDRKLSLVFEDPFELARQLLMLRAPSFLDPQRQIELRNERYEQIAFPSGAFVSYEIHSIQ